MSSIQLVKSEKFGTMTCDVFKNDKDFFMTRQQIGEALEYSDPKVAIAKLHASHKDRLDRVSRVTATVTVDGKTRETVIYSSKGIYEICRWSQQPKADEFYDFIYDLLEQLRTGKSKVVPLSKDQALVTVLRTTADLVEDNQAIKTEQHEIRKLITQVDQKVETQITLDHGEQRKVQKVVARRVGDFEKYDKKRRSELFHEIYREIKDRFAVPSYKDVLRKDLPDVVRYIEAFIPKKVA
ncbi:ORF6C domain-containing protein [Sporolactobacillus shoreicorticis]|uniref:ORF6C domain-containing protein n=1 Tax=Sporolactobacillus shoreicorticis TaxID=1923877 RepID=A0ABW5S5R0_9BACL|nr:ORF6C domain-containing protein [Sporolactobacillus shoreicorticis]MCO7127766.1 ORF6C domain-containing protein [Sporolactobacillus shoreicorticis]